MLWNTGNKISIFVKPPEPSFPENLKREYWSLWHWQDVVADWNWNGYENHLMDVVVYSSTEMVELFLNGKSLGKKETSMATRYAATWQVPYQAGILRAVGLNKNTLVAETKLESAGKPVALKMTCDRSRIKADGQDLSYITIELVDEKGRTDPKARNMVDFKISGPGRIVGVGNADPMSIESYQLPRRSAWKGRCLVIIKSQKEEGEITVSASVDGIAGSEITIKSGED